MADDIATEFREAFYLIDRDFDGEIRADEVASVIELMSWEPRKDEMEVVMEDFEADHVTLDFQQLLDIIMYREMKEDVVEEELKEAFQVFDSDQDGFISATELRNVMLNLGEKISEERS